MESPPPGSHEKNMPWEIWLRDLKWVGKMIDPFGSDSMDFFENQDQNHETFDFAKNDLCPLKAL